MDLEQWLTAHGLEQHLEIFVENLIEVDVLEHLTEADLREMGLPIGSVRRFLAAVQPQGQGSVDQAPTTAAPQSAAQPVPQPPASQTPVQHPAASTPPQQKIENQPASQPVHPAQPAIQQPPHLAPPASSPQVTSSTQTQAVQATRHQPKAKNSRKATAVMIAVGVHVAIILLATTLTIFAASKDEPEIIASIAPPATSPQQEMKKKTVQKQVKRAPSSASAAAAPMAIMMKANAEARFTTPDVTRTSTGPLGMGEGDVGAGAFGVGTGVGAGAGGGAMFMGTQTKGKSAVIFDVSGSMATAVPFVVKEIKRAFADAQVVAVYGCQFADNTGDEKRDLVPYEDNKILSTRVKNSTSDNPKIIQLNKEMHEALLSLENSLSLSEKTQTRQLQNMGLAIERLLEQSAAKRPSTIFVFADFRDRITSEVMERVKKLLNRTQTKIVFYQANDRFRDPEEHQKIKRFIEGIDGEIKIGLR